MDQGLTEVYLPFLERVPDSRAIALRRAWAWGRENFRDAPMRVWDAAWAVCKER